MPPPSLAKDTIPLPRMTPLKVLETSLLPTVKVALPTTLLSTVPLPLSPLMVSLFPARSRVPSTTTFPLPLPSGITLEAPSLRVP